MKLPAQLSFGGLTSLQRLHWDLFGCQPPLGIGTNLVRLTQLDLYDVRTSEWAPVLAQLTQVKRLSFSTLRRSGELDSSMDFVLGMTALETLICTCAFIRSLPAGITALSR